LVHHVAPSIAAEGDAVAQRRLEQRHLVSYQRTAVERVVDASADEHLEPGVERERPLHPGRRAAGRPVRVAYDDGRPGRKLVPLPHFAGLARLARRGPAVLEPLIHEVSLESNLPAKIVVHQLTLL